MTQSSAAHVAPPEYSEARNSILEMLDTQGGLSVRFQPILRVRRAGHALHAFEAFVHGPSGSRLESTGAILDFLAPRVSSQERNLACLAAAFRSARSLDVTSLISVNIDASAISAKPGFAHRIKDLADAFDIERSRVIVEINGLSADVDTKAVTMAARELHSVGLRVALDDTGWGECPLSLLWDAGPEYLKIDRALIRGLSAGSSQSITLEATVKLAKSVGFQPVAEGVETALERDALLELGITLMQGFLFYRPLRAREISATAFYDRDDDDAWSNSFSR